MDEMDFSELTPDQIAALIRGLCREAVRRGADVEAAAQAAVLEEAEAARIRKEAAEREAAKLRAQERERIAREAAEEVRRAREREMAEIERQRVEREAQEALRRAQARERRERDILRRAAELVDRAPSEISVLVVVDYRGRHRVLINPGADRYERDHLVDYHHGRAEIATKRDLVSRKPELIKYCAGLAAQYKTLHLAGANYDWSNENEQ